MSSRFFGIFVLRRVQRRFRCFPPAATCVRRLSQEASLEKPPLDGEEKEYSAKIRQLVTEIGQLTLLEAADLNELLKKTFKIADMPVSMSAPIPRNIQEEAAEKSAEEEKTEFDVKLLGFADGKKAKVIKEIKAMIEGLNLVEAKKLVESTPQSLKKGISKEEAEEVKKILETAGASVEIV